MTLFNLRSATVANIVLAVFLIPPIPTVAVIVNDDADLIVGRVQPLTGCEGPFRVSAELAPQCENDEVAVVETIQEVVPTLLAYYDKNPPVWEHRGTIYIRDTQFCIFAGAIRCQGRFDSLSRWLPNVMRRKACSLFDL